MKKAIVVASCFILIGVTISAQEKAPGMEHNSSTPTLNWSEKPDVKKWLTENAALLNRGDACSLFSSWANEKHPTDPPGSVWEIATFVAIPGDELTRLIHDSASGLDVRVGVRYFPASLSASAVPGQSYGLQIALAFEGPADDVFDEISRAEAETLRYSNWKSLAVVKPIRVGDMRYRFSFMCENGQTFMSFLRRPAKKSQSAKSTRK